MSCEATERGCHVKDDLDEVIIAERVEVFLCITWITVARLKLGGLKMSASSQRQLSGGGRTQGSPRLTSGHHCGTRPGVSVAALTLTRQNRKGNVKPWCLDFYSPGDRYVLMD